MDKSFELKDKMGWFIGWCDRDINRSIIFFFFHWLRKEQALIPFLQNLPIKRQTIYYSDDFIISSFGWANKPQKPIYWSNMHKKWMRALSKYYKYIYAKQESK